MSKVAYIAALQQGFEGWDSDTSNINWWGEPRIKPKRPKEPKKPTGKKLRAMNKENEKYKEVMGKGEEVAKECYNEGVVAESTPEKENPTADETVGQKETDEVTENNYRNSSGDRVNFVIKNRVSQTQEGEWVAIQDGGISQEKSVYAGVVYESSKGRYWFTSAEDEWIRATETSVKNYLYHDRQITEKESIDKTMNFITRTANVEFSTPLAGHSKGIYEYDGRRILVINSPTIIQPKKGDWSTINRLPSQMFGSQLDYFLGWMQIAYVSLRSGDFVPGQICVLAGPRDCGKTLLQTKIITPVFGGRDARPYQYMTAQTQFNSDLVKAEHLIIADEVPATEYKERVAFGAAIKQLVAEPKQRLHQKGKDAIMVEPFWRVSLSINDEPENLMILPPLNDSMLDKLMLFKVTRPNCLPGDVNGERRAFGAALHREMPAFVHFLANEFEIPASLRKGRFGIREYCNPDLILSLEELSTEAALMSLIDQELFPEESTREKWEGDSGSLSAVLKGRDAASRSDAEKLFRNPKVLGRILSTLEKNKGTYQGVVTSRTLHGRKMFTIHRNYRNRDRD